MAQMLGVDSVLETRLSIQGGVYRKTIKLKNKPYVSHAQFFPLIYKNCPAQSGLHQREQFRTVFAVAVAIIAISRHRARIVVIFDKDTVPAIVIDHGSLPLGDWSGKVFDGPLTEAHPGLAWCIIYVYDVEDEDHIELAVVAAHGADNFINIADARHFANGDGTVLLQNLVFDLL